VVGNVWQWTASEFVDAHTRSVLVRGSSSYVPHTDNSQDVKFSWYFQPSLELDTHNRWLAQKGLLPYSRAATVGFRCLKDVPGGAPAPLHTGHRESSPLASPTVASEVRPQRGGRRQGSSGASTARAADRLREGQRPCGKMMRVELRPHGRRNALPNVGRAPLCATAQQRQPRLARRPARPSVCRAPALRLPTGSAAPSESVLRVGDLGISSVRASSTSGPLTSASCRRSRSAWSA